MHDWQKDIWAAFAGSDPREMKIVMGGRQIGKSVMAQMWNEVNEMQSKPYTEETSAEVDGRMWYTISCTKPVAEWIRQQPGEHTQWDNLIDNKWYIYFDRFDVHEEFYMMLKLRWGA